MEFARDVDLIRDFIDRSDDRKIVISLDDIIAI